MAITLYYAPLSPPARAVHLTLESLKIPYELSNINLAEGDQRNQDFVEKNPQHTVPTIQDGDFYLWDSHAINAYLVNKYAENDDLYPKEPKKRAIIDQRLHFDTGVLFPSLKTVVRGVRAKTLTVITTQIVQNFEEAYAFVEKFLMDNKYAVGDSITIADFSFVTSLESMMRLVSLDEQKFPLIKKYLDLCKSTIPKYKEINEYGTEEYVTHLKTLGLVFSSQKN